MIEELSPIYRDKIKNRYKKNISLQDYTTYSRFANLLYVTDNEGDSYIESYEGLEIPTSPQDKYFKVTKKYEHRLDLISFKFYNNPRYYWLIAEANDIFNPLILPVDTVLRIPPLSVIYGFKGVLRQ